MDTTQHQAATLACFSLIESDLKYKAKTHIIPKYNRVGSPNQHSSQNTIALINYPLIYTCA